MDTILLTCLHGYSMTKLNSPSSLSLSPGNRVAYLSKRQKEGPQVQDAMWLGAQGLKAKRSN